MDTHAVMDPVFPTGKKGQHLSADIILALRTEIQQGFDNFSQQLLQEIRVLCSPQQATVSAAPSATADNETLHPKQVAFNLAPLSSNTIQSAASSDTGHSTDRNAVQKKDDDLRRHGHALGYQTAEISSGPYYNENEKRLKSKTTYFGSDRERFGRSAHLDESLKPWRSLIQHRLAKQDYLFQKHIEAFIARCWHLCPRYCSKQHVFSRLVGSRCFALFSLTIIICNTVWMGWEVNNITPDNREHLLTVNRAFLVWFVVELCLRMAVYRLDFIFGPDYRWNVFDFMMVMASVPEFFSTSLTFSHIRILRLARITRTAFLIRKLKLMVDLREITTTIVCTTVSMFWCSLAIVVVSYIFAIFFMQVLHRDHTGADRHRYSGEIYTEMFTSTGNSVMTLLAFVTGGLEWYDVYQDLHEPEAKYGLVIYIFFMTVGCLNITVGVFCNKANEAAMMNQQLRLEKEEHLRTQKVKDLAHIFELIDREHRGFIEWDQFRRFLKSHHAPAMLQVHGLQMFDMRKLWELMDSYDGSKDGCVDMAGFVMGIVRLSPDFVSTNLITLQVEVAEIGNCLQMLLGQGFAAAGAPSYQSNGSYHTCSDPRSGSVESSGKSTKVVATGPQSVDEIPATTAAVNAVPTTSAGKILTSKSGTAEVQPSGFFDGDQTNERVLATPSHIGRDLSRWRL